MKKIVILFCLCLLAAGCATRPEGFAGGFIEDGWGHVKEKMYVDTSARPKFDHIPSIVISPDSGIVAGIDTGDPYLTGEIAYGYAKQIMPPGEFDRQLYDGFVHFLDVFGMNKTVYSESELKIYFHREYGTIRKKLLEGRVITVDVSMTDGSRTKTLSFTVTDNKSARCIMGLPVFRGARNIVFDYRRGFFEVNASPFSDTAAAVPMRVVETSRHEKLYQAEIEIDGKKEWALIDTGSDSFFRRSDFSRELTEVTGGDFNKEITLKKNTARTYTVKIGTYEYTVKGYDSMDGHFTAQNVARIMLQYTNDIGYPFFKGRRIMLDFEHSLFWLE